MRTVVLGPRPAELDALIARRHALGQDTHDEVWEGEYHMAPAVHPWHGYLSRQLARALEPFAQATGLISIDAFNLGTPHNYRVPDGGLHRSLPSTTFVATAAMVIELVSPDDESWLKFDHYASCGVDEILIVDPYERAIAMFVLDGNEYRRTDRSELLDVTAQQLDADIDWPSAD